MAATNGGCRAPILIGFLKKKLENLGQIDQEGYEQFLETFLALSFPI